MTNIFITGIDLSDNKSVLLLPPEHFDDDKELFELRQILFDRFPNCNFVILGGGWQLVATTASNIHYEIEVE